MDDDGRIARWIALDPLRPWPAEARIRDFGVPVWALIGHYRYATGHDVERVATDYELPLEAVEAALAYYGRHQAEIDARLAANAA